MATASHKKKQGLHELDYLRRAFRKDLEQLFKLAMEDNQYSVALKAKELLAKEAGLFTVSKPSPTSGKKHPPPSSPQDLSDEALETLIQALLSQDTLFP